MLLNRVRCEAMEKIRVYFDRNLCRFLPPKESIFLICDTLLLIHLKKQQQFLSFFNMRGLTCEFRLFFTHFLIATSTR